METQLSYAEQKQINKAKKVMLWFGMISMAMVFAGLTSAYIVSSNRPDWLADFEMPLFFYISSAFILFSSLTFHLAKTSIKGYQHNKATALLIITFALAIGFVIFQFKGFSEIIEMGYFFTGASSNITTSFIYVMVIAHLVHLFFGLITLLVVIYNNYKEFYSPQKLLGFELGLTFWHFLGIIWTYLFLFFIFVG